MCIDRVLERHCESWALTRPHARHGKTLLHRRRNPLPLGLAGACQSPKRSSPWSTLSHCPSTTPEHAFSAKPPRFKAHTRDQHAVFMVAALVYPSGLGADAADVFVGLRRKTVHVAVVGSIRCGPCEYTTSGSIRSKPHVAAECRQLAHDSAGISPSQTRFLRLQRAGWRLV